MIGPMASTSVAGSLPFTVRRANTFLERLVGLLTVRVPDPDVALLLEPCACVHTFGMRFPIDVVFVDACARVIGIHQHVRARRVVGCPGARATLEFTAGAVARFGIAAGMVLPALVMSR